MEENGWKTKLATGSLIRTTPLPRSAQTWSELYPNLEPRPLFQTDRNAPVANRVGVGDVGGLASLNVNVVFVLVWGSDLELEIGSNPTNAPLLLQRMPPSLYSRGVSTETPRGMYPGSVDITESGTVSATPEKAGNYTAWLLATNPQGNASRAKMKLSLLQDVVVVKKWEFEVKDVVVDAMALDKKKQGARIMTIIPSISSAVVVVAGICMLLYKRRQYQLKRGKHELNAKMGTEGKREPKTRKSNSTVESTDDDFVYKIPDVGVPRQSVLGRNARLSTGSAINTYVDFGTEGNDGGNYGVGRRSNGSNGSNGGHLHGSVINNVQFAASKRASTKRASLASGSTERWEHRLSSVDLLALLDTPVPTSANGDYLTLQESQQQQQPRTRLSTHVDKQRLSTLSQSSFFYEVPDDQSVRRGRSTARRQISDGSEGSNGFYGCVTVPLNDDNGSHRLSRGSTERRDGSVGSDTFYASVQQASQQDAVSNGSHRLSRGSTERRDGSVGSDTFYASVWLAGAAGEAQQHASRRSTEFERHENVNSYDRFHPTSRHAGAEPPSYVHVPPPDEVRWNRRASKV